jgi:hypothetical protein
MTYALALDVFVAGLLVITIGLAGVLNHRLGKLRRERADLEKLTAEFQDATVKANEASRHLTVDAESLREGIEKAQSLHEDLVFLIERAGGAADRLEDQIRTARNHGERPISAAASPAPQPARPKMRIAANAEQPATRSQAERDLLHALRSAS